MSFDEVKCQEISQSIPAIFDHADASLAEICAASSVALRVALDSESDKMLRAYLLMNLIKHLTIDHEKNFGGKPGLELIVPNGD